MVQRKIFLDYSGPIDQAVIDNILYNLKKTQEYRNLGKVPGKRVYSIVVESLENMLKHTARDTGYKNGKHPYISAGELEDCIIIHAGNPVSYEKTDLLTARLNKVNNMSMEGLTNLYEHILNREARLSENGAGAGLGFIFMRLKSGRKIDFGFTRINDSYSLFEIQVSVNKNTMRKLIIDKTVSSPSVIFDPDINKFEISGESRPSDVASFYIEILKWFDDYASSLGRMQEQKDPAVFNFDFEYFNSSSAKYILDFCKQIGDARSKGNNLEVRWHYDKDDLDMLQVGREMSKISKTPFEYIEKEID